MKTENQNNLIIVRGAGEMASGVIHRLYNSGYKMIVLEQPNPVCVRRLVCFANAVYENEFSVEGVKSRLVRDIDEAISSIESEVIPIMVDSNFETINSLKYKVIIDCRMLKKEVQSKIMLSKKVIGLGPGFDAGVNCLAVIETNRGDDLGKVIYKGKPEAYTGIPAEVNSFTHDRVLRAPSDGEFVSNYKIGDCVKAGDEIGKVNNISVTSNIDGVLRGLIHERVQVTKSQKIGDVDPRGNKNTCFKISDKASAIGSGVLEALHQLGVKQ